MMPRIMRRLRFAGSKIGGDRAAAIYTVIETCKMNNVEPQAYIADVIAKNCGRLASIPLGRTHAMELTKQNRCFQSASSISCGLQATLTQDGILAPQLLPCPMAGMIFQQWLEECLIPEMQPGSIFIIDNLPAHKVAGIRRCLEAAGMHLLYLPPYSPDFNPIEQVFATLKALLRRMDPNGSAQSAMPSKPSSKSSNQTNAHTTSATPAMCKCDRF
jgi:DDE superfamily endonuclease/IS66 C-terminal element